MINLKNIANQERAPASTGFEGHWHAIEFQPDLSVPQRFVIGVALSSRGKLSHHRLAAEAPKLKCFYESRFTPTVWKWLRDELSTELDRARNSSAKAFVSTSPQITLSPGQYVSAIDADSALGRTFERVVTVVQKDKKLRLQGINQADLRLAVARNLKLAWKNRYEQIAMPEGGMPLKDHDQLHLFDVSFDDHITAASVVSGCNAGLETSRLNVMTAWTDLQALAQIRKRDQIGIAVLVPTLDLLPAPAVQAWNTWWSDFSYKLRESSSVLLAEDTNAEGLALQISHWYDEK